MARSKNWTIPPMVLEKIKNSAGARLAGNLHHLFSRINPPVESPIEKIFHISLFSACFANAVAWRIKDEPVGKDNWVRVSMQKQIEGKRVDFFVECGNGEARSSAIIECDGAEFHHGNEDRNAQDKARDRLLAPHARFILRYTGKEIYADPFGVAEEALRIVIEDVAKNQKLARAEEPR